MLLLTEISMRLPIGMKLVAMFALLHGCSAVVDDAAALRSDDDYGGMPQIMSQTKMTAVKAALPKVAWPQLQAILNSSETMWYDKDSMKPCYQDSVGDGSYTPIGARLNNEGKGLIVPEGQKFFADDGQTWSFPFGHTAGMDEAENALIVNFLSLPVGADGKPLPVVYQIVDDSSGAQGLGLHRWTWMYPKGATVGEMIFVKDASGNLYPSELRTRTRYSEGWATNSYRPFPTAASFAAAIKAARPNWQQNDKLKSAVAQVESTSGLRAKSIGSPGFNGILTLDGAVDELPDLGDDELVKELLTKTTFVSVYGDAWKTNGSQKAYGANASGFSVFPRNNSLGLIEVSDDSCNRCHDNAGRLLADYEDATVLYGDLWGEDRIFSFHIYDTSRVGGAGTENRAVRKELAGIVQRYDHGKHPADLYKQLKRVGN
jgi:hypothetical protein